MEFGSARPLPVKMLGISSDSIGHGLEMSIEVGLIEVCDSVVKGMGKYRFFGIILFIFS